MAFKFSLAAVLRVRQTIEDREQLKLEQILREIVLCEQGVEACEQRRQQLWRARDIELKQLSTAYHLHLVEIERRAMEEETARLQLKLRELQATREKQLLMYQSARQAREVIAGIRDRQMKSYKLAISRQEQKALDDVFSSRHGHK